LAAVLNCAHFLNKKKKKKKKKKKLICALMIDKNVCDVGVASWHGS
jgi:hypothetical protein